MMFWAGLQMAEPLMLFANYLSEPTHIEAMRSAFRKVCGVLQLRCDADGPVTDRIVMKIVEHAKAGELNPDRLCSQVLRDIAMRTWTPGPIAGASEE
jgi:hypothetical protein